MRKGIRKQDFAEALGIAPPNLSRYLNGDSLPNKTVLLLIAQQGCNIHWLLTGEGSMFADNAAGRELQARLQHQVPHE